MNADLTLMKILSLYRAYSIVIKMPVALAFVAIFFFTLASPLCAQPAYADQVINDTYNNTINQTYNLTNGQIAELKARGAMFYPNGYIMTPFGPENFTYEERVALHITDEDLAKINASAIGETKQVSFLELPTWIQISFLSGALVTILFSMIAIPAAVRKIRSPLVNQNRNQVFNYIMDNPGCTAPEVSRGQHLNTGTVRYHIQRLELAGKIVMKKIGKFTRLYKNASSFNDREMVIASHLRNETSSRLLQAILEDPGLTNQRLSERFNLDKSTVYVHIQKLVNDEIVVSEADGKQKRYFVSESAKESLRKLMPLNYQCPGMMRDHEKDQFNK